LEETRGVRTDRKSVHGLVLRAVKKNWDNEESAAEQSKKKKKKRTGKKKTKERRVNTKKGKSLL